MTDIVLVHGAFHGGWCWRRVADRLAASGHRVFCPTLTGLGERAHLLSPAVDLETHIADITGLMAAEEVASAVLVCHSYGGMPATGAADRTAGRLAALVWLDAYLPEDGESTFEIRERHGGGPTLTSTDNLTLTPPPIGAFGLAGDDGAWVARHMTPHPLATCQQPIRLTGAFRTITEKLYIRATRYDAGYFDASLARAAAAGWRTQSHDLAHDMMVSDPEWTAATIMAAIPG